LPLSELPLLRREKLAPYFYDWLAHPDGDDYWERSCIMAHHSQIHVPALNIGGWYDLFPAGPLDNFVGISEHGATDAARTGQKLIVGPWVHAFPPPAITGQRNFGWDSVLNWGELQYRWFDHWLKDIDNGVERERAVRIFVMNRGWRVEDEWPLTRTRYTHFFLHSDGRANTLDGDGVLSIDPSSAEPPDTFSYDPMDPVPTVGAQGIHDHRRVETRSDVLIYSTPPLTEEIEVTGPIKLTLFAASSAPDTDFTAKLIDVAPNGYAANLCEGIVRTRYRDTARRSTLMEPGSPYQFTIDLIATSNLFQRGHRIRLEVSSSNFPRFDRNLNTGGPVAASTEPRIARQTVFHDSELPSHLLLPIVSER